jgi:hypothetical protein
MFTPHDTPTKSHWCVGIKMFLRYDTVRFGMWVPPRHGYLPTTMHVVCVPSHNRLILKLNTMRTSMSHFCPRSTKPSSVVHISLEAFIYRRLFFKYSLHLIAHGWRKNSRKEGQAFQRRYLLQNMERPNTLITSLHLFQVSVLVIIWGSSQR